MRITALTFAAVLLTLASRPAAAQRAPAGSGRSESPGPKAGTGIVGVWRVAHFCGTDSLGRQYVPFEQPVGYFIYTKDGLVSLQFGPARGTPGATPSVLDRMGLSPAERQAYERGWVAYFGRYTVTSDSTLVHHVEGGTIASYVGTDQLRPYRITGRLRDTLAIGDLHPGCRVLVRVE